MVLYRALALAASTLCAARAALPVRFATVPGTEVLDATWHCVSLMLQPEERDFAVPVDPLFSPERVRRAHPDACGRCHGLHGVYVDADRLRAFVRASLATADGGEGGGAAVAPRLLADAATATASVDADGASAAEPLSPLAAIVASWNRKLFGLGRASRAYWAHFHERATEDARLAYEATFFAPPADLMDRLRARLHNHSHLFFESGGSDVPSIGAAMVGSASADAPDAMSVLFPSADADADADGLDDGHDRASPRARGHRIETDRDARKRAALVGESYGARDGGDMEVFERAVAAAIGARADVRKLFGEDAAASADFKFQHRLWRFGPRMDRKTGGVWHVDTCPWGSGLETHPPPGTIMFTLVFIVHTENIVAATAGTRLQDPLGGVTQLPCEAGHGTLIRTDSVTHAGPLRLDAEDASRPSYRMMMQTKIIVAPREGRRASPSVGAFTHAAPGAHWRALGLADAPPRVAAADADAAAADAAAIAAMGAWLGEVSANISRAPDTRELAWPAAPYPLDAARAWQVVRDLCEHMGFVAAQLPDESPPTTPVALFGLTYETSPVIARLEDAGFRTVQIASAAQFAKLHADDPDRFSNLAFKIESGVPSSAERVAAVLDAEQLDVHLLVDVPPDADGFDATLREFGAVLAANARSVASVTYLSSARGGDARRRAEREWLGFGEAHDVRVNVLRLADRVYSHKAEHAGTSISRAERDGDNGDDADDLARGGGGLCALSTQHERPTACRDAPCATDEPISRVHLEDLTDVVVRALELMDAWNARGAARALTRANASVVVDVVDDARRDSMDNAVFHCRLMSGEALTSPELCTEARDPSATQKLSLDAAADHPNARMKQEFDIERLKYPTYRHTLAAAMLSGSFEGLV